MKRTAERFFVVCFCLFLGSIGLLTALLPKETGSFYENRSLATFPVAWLCRWMRHDAAGAALYFGIFFAIYALIWLGQYLGIRRRVREMNREIGARRSQENT